MPKQYCVDLTPDERAHLVALTRKGKASARQVTRAHVLLHAADGLTDATIAAACPHEQRRNDQQATVSWHFTTEHARQKLDRFYRS